MWGPESINIWPGSNQVWVVLWVISGHGQWVRGVVRISCLFYRPSTDTSFWFIRDWSKRIFKVFFCREIVDGVSVFVATYCWLSCTICHPILDPRRSGAPCPPCPSFRVTRNTRVSPLKRSKYCSSPTFISWPLAAAAAGHRGAVIKKELAATVTARRRLACKHWHEVLLPPNWFGFLFEE